MAAVHVLIAEDEKHVRLTLGLTLRQAGYRVTMAENGLEAFGIIGECAGGPGRVDLLITDIQMPQLDGLALMDRLRENGIQVPMVGITGLGDRQLSAELQRRGCREYLGKPFTPGEVLSRVEKVLEQNRLLKMEQERRCPIKKYGCKGRQEGRSQREHFHSLCNQFGSAAAAYRNLISRTAGTDKFPSACENLPLADLGGDYLGVRDMDKGCDVLLADVAGHDSEAFFHAMLVKDFFEDDGLVEFDLQSIFNSLNQHLLVHGGRERLIKAILLRLDLAVGQGYLVSAAHPPLIADSRNWLAPRALLAEGSVLGIHEQVIFSLYQFPLLPSDRYFMFSDGVLTARRQQDRIGLAFLTDLIHEERGKAIETAVRGIWKQVMDYCGNRPHDDMTLLGLEIPG
jgi:phosphoserine phosphatase RsbU/P